MIYRCKTVGMKFYNVENEVENGDYLILIAEEDNPHDSDAIAVYNGEREKVGYIANSPKTLLPGNIRAGNISATDIKQLLNFNNREYYAEVINAYSSCIYLEINDGKWGYKRY